MLFLRIVAGLFFAGSSINALMSLFQVAGADRLTAAIYLAIGLVGLYACYRGFGSHRDRAFKIASIMLFLCVPVIGFGAYVFRSYFFLSFAFWIQPLAMPTPMIVGIDLLPVALVVVFSIPSYGDYWPFRKRRAPSPV